MRLRSTLRVTTTWASPRATAAARTMPVAAFPLCLTMTLPLAPRPLRPVVVMLTSLVAPAPSLRCRRLFTVVPASIESTMITRPPLINTKVARRLSSTAMPTLDTK